MLRELWIDGDSASGEALERPSAIVDLANAARREAGDERTTARLLDDEPFRSKLTDRLAHRRSADPHLGRDLRIRHALSRAKPATEDGIAKVGRDQLDERR